MESALNPREIQTRIRSGASIEQVATECGVPASQVEPFATPVLAERQHQALSALQSPVRRRGETGSNRTLRTVVAESLLSQGIDVDTVDWDAWRTDDRLWIVVGRYAAPGAGGDGAAGSDRTNAHENGSDEDAAGLQEPQWRFDPRARYSTAVNDQARALIGEADFAAPARRRPGFRGDFEPTIDLTDERALVRASQDAAEMTIPLPSSSRQREDNLVAPQPSPSNYDELAARQGNASAHAIHQHGEGEAAGPREVRPQPTGERIEHNPESSPQTSGAADVPATGTDRPARFTQPQTPQQPAPDHDAPEALDAQPRAHHLQPGQAEPAGSMAPEQAQDREDTRGAAGDDDTANGADGYVDTELEQVDGVYDFVPSHTASLDSLYDMLQGFNEDSVNIYEGLDRLPPMVARGDSTDPDPDGETARDDDAARTGSVLPTGGEGVTMAGVEFGAPQAAPQHLSVDRVELTRVEVSHPDAGHPEHTQVDVTDVELLGIEVTEENLAALQHSHDEIPQQAAPRGTAQQESTRPRPADQDDTATAHPVPLGVPAQDDGTGHDGTGADVPDAEAVATGWPASMGTEREPQTTLENPVDHAVNDAARAASTPAASAEPAPADHKPADHKPADHAPEPAAQAPAPSTPAPVPTGNAPGNNAPQANAVENNSPENEETKAIAPRPKRRKRAAVPSWDEIMFGGPGRSDI